MNAEHETLRKWHLGSMNDGLFIIDQPPRPSTDDVHHERTDGPELVLPVHGLTVKQAQAICDAHNALLDRVEVLEKAKPTHRHKKRGTEYVLLGIGKMQADNWFVRGWNDVWQSETFKTPADMREVAVYRSVDDGSLWVRPVEEFEDGRFEALSSGASS